MKNLKGQLPKKSNLSMWKEIQFMRFFAMVHYFCPKNGWEVHEMSVEAFLERVRNEKCQYWTEFMWRFEINDPDNTYDRLRLALMGVTAKIGKYLQDNPVFITKDMRATMKAHPKLEQYTEQHAIKETDMGSMVVSTNPETNKLILFETVNGLVRMARELSKLTPAELKTIPAAKKVELSIKITKMIADANLKLSNEQEEVLSKLNAKTATRKELEAALIVKK